MQVSVGQEGPGYMPWSSAAEVWVGWCYPYPRPVQVILTLGSKMLLACPFNFSIQLEDKPESSFLLKWQLELGFLGRV